MTTMGAGHPRDTEEPGDAASGEGRALLTPAELADRWGVTTGHLANLRHQGEGIGYLKIGSRVAYLLSEVVAYEDSVYVSVGVGVVP